MEEFIKSQERKLRAKIVHEIDLLERFGPQLRETHSKKVQKGLWELRIRGETEIRILYTFIDKTILLLHAFKKKGQKIPSKEMNIASDRMARLKK